MNRKEKLNVVKRWLSVARFEYETLMKVEEAAMSSAGLVARYDAIGGGRSGQLSDRTAQAALHVLKIDELYRIKMLWLDAIFAAYEKLHSLTTPMGPKGLMRGLHDRCVARVIYGKVFRGYTLAYTGQCLVKENVKLSRQAVYNLWQDAVVAVLKEAEKRNLF